MVSTTLCARSSRRILACLCCKVSRVVASWSRLWGVYLYTHFRLVCACLSQGPGHAVRVFRVVEGLSAVAAQFCAFYFRSLASTLPPAITEPIVSRNTNACVACERLWSLVRLRALIHIPVLSIVGGLGDAVVSDRTHIMLYEVVL